MRIFDNAQKWDDLLNSFSNNIDKGKRFEDLVSSILENMFADRNLKFEPTQETHDGSKDFWAVDDERKVWWAECKNYATNISVKVLSPTLFMAELYDIDFLLFFSYSRLNSNLLRKIGLYSNKHSKRVFIYDDTSLEYIICKLFPNTVEDILGFSPEVVSIEPIVTQFNEKNPLFFNADNFDGFYSIDKLTSGEVYNLNTLILNRSDQSMEASVAIKQNADLKYFRLIGKQNNVSHLHPFELLLFSYKAQVIKNKKELSLPQINVELNDKKIKSNDLCQKYECDRGHNSLLIGKNYENIITRASEICCTDSISGFLIYGNGGSGKTRILYECYLNLLLNDYKVLNFTNFDSGNNWRDVVREIVYNIFAIDEDMVLDILCNIQNENPLLKYNNALSEENKCVYDFLIILKNCDDDTELISFYEIIFEKMRKNKYAIIIDNFQSYSLPLVRFFEKMIDYYLHCNRPVNVSLLFSINIELLFDNCFSAFISKFIKLQNDSFKSAFYCKEITGFQCGKQALVFLNSKLKLNEIPHYSSIKSIVENQGVLKPKYLEQIAEYLLTRGCVIIVDEQGYVDDTAFLEECLKEIPTGYKELFSYNYQKILNNYTKEHQNFELIFSVIFLFEKIENNHIKNFNLSRKALNILLKHRILKNNGSADFPQYTVEHDLSFECLTTIIYVSLIHIIAKKIVKLEVPIRLNLGISDSYYFLCKLVLKSASAAELKNTDLDIIDNLQNRHKLIFAEHYLDCVIANLTETPELMVSKANQICKFVNDHISVKKAERLFETTYSFIRLMCNDDSSVLRQLFSFYIHMAENKIHMSKHKEAMDIYADFLLKIKGLTNDKCSILKELDYAKAYILNRRFVCGKIEGDAMKYNLDLHESKKICERYGFWDIQFENYFDESNVYRYDASQKELLLNCLDMGFVAFRKTTRLQKIKFMPNFLSKKLQFLCMKQEFSKALCVAEYALRFLDNNTAINYHLFFKKRYLKYKFICLVALNETKTLDDLLQELSVINDLSGSTDKFEILYYNAIYFLINNMTDRLYYCYKKMYYIASSGIYKNPDCITILMDLGIKLRLLMRDAFKPMPDIDLENKSLSPVNEILTVNKKQLDAIKGNFHSNALIVDDEHSIGFYY